METDKSQHVTRNFRVHRPQCTATRKKRLHQHDRISAGRHRFGSARWRCAGSGSASNDSFEQEAGYQLNAAGQRQENNQYDVDGSIAVSASRDGVVNLSPEPDFIQAVRISGATIDAAKGRYSGAYVQVFTKPGTNEYTGRCRSTTPTMR